MDIGVIAADIQEFLEQSFPRQDRVLTPATDLLKGWFVDSLGVVMTVVFLEERFGITLRQADVREAHFQNINSLAAFVAERLQHGA